VKRPTLFLLLGVALVAAAAPMALSATRQAHKASTSVGVTGKEFKFGLSSKSARHGTITFRFSNKGKLKHDFKIDGKATPVIKPGKSATIRVRLSAGRYKYLCTVPGHARAGMKGTFRVR
jgi:uncharacterized cupredoxin-like copper-binding protein